MELPRHNVLVMLENFIKRIVKIRPKQGFKDKQDRVRSNTNEHNRSVALHKLFELYSYKITKQAFLP